MTQKNVYIRKTKDIPRHVELVDRCWPVLIYRLRGLGYSLAKIARSLGSTRENMYAILEGRREPSYSQGVFILELITWHDTGEMR